MNTLRFNVREVRQMSSGGSHVVIYSAELDLLDAAEPCVVEIVNTIPAVGDADRVEEVRERIRLATIAALDGSGHSARVRVRDFLIHDSDFRLNPVEGYTFLAIRRLLDPAS